MTPPFGVSATRDGVRLDLRVIPRSPVTKIDGVRDGRLVLRVTAPPVDAAANDAVVATIAKTLGVSRSAVRIVIGGTSRNKTVEVTGLSAATVLERIPV